MNADYFRTLIDYNYWARDRLLAATQDLPQSDYVAENGFTYGSIRGILIHCLDGEYGWRCRLQDEPDRGVLRPDNLPTVSTLVDRWHEEEALMRAYVAGLTEEDLATDVVWHAKDGSEHRLPHRWLTLAHVVNHSTQHRSEGAEALTMLGRSPGDLDLGLYAREKRTAGRSKKIG